MFKNGRHIVFLLCFGFSVNSFSQSIMVGAGVSYGTDISQFGPNFRIYYGLNEHICFGPEFSFFPEVKKGDHLASLSEYGFVLHYIFEFTENFGAYPLVGINYSVETRDHSEKEKSFAPSVGAGFHYAIGNYMPFTEYKFIGGKLSQSTFSLGLIYNFHLKKTESHHDN